MDGLVTLNADVNVSAPSVGDLYLCSLIGLGVTALLFVITDYYTSTRFGPVKKTAAASQTGHATNIIQASRRACRPRRCPALVLALGILGRRRARPASTASASRSWRSCR